MTRFVLNTDGGARGNPGPAGIGWLISDGAGMALDSGAAYVGVATNNQAEYLALIAGLQAALRRSPDHLVVRMDSELVVRQMRGEYRVKHADLKPLHARASQLVAAAAGTRVEFSHVPRERNSEADALYNSALDAALAAASEG